MSSEILILYTKGPQELKSRQSALGSYIASLAKLFFEAGHKVRLNDWSYEELFSEEASVGIGMAETSGWRRGFLSLIPRYVKQWLKDLQAIRHADTLSRRLKEQPAPDLILDIYTFGSRTGVELAQHWGCPYYMIYDGPVLEEYSFFQGIEAPMGRMAQRRQVEALRHAKGVVVYSDAMVDYVLNLAQLPDQQTLYLHQNVDFSRFEFCDAKDKPEMQPIHIGFIGSFLPWHRVDLLVKVFERLRENGYPVQLHLVGYGLEWPRIQAMVEESPWRADIHLPGFQDRSELYATKQQLHIGVVPSAIWYQAPNKLFEYGAMGIACLAPPTPTISYLYQADKEVKFFENNNEEALFEALEELVSEPLLIQQMGEAIQQKIRKDYGPDKTLAFYTDMMELGD